MLFWDAIAIAVVAVALGSIVSFLLGGLSPNARVITIAVISAVMWHGANHGNIQPGHTLRDVILKPVLGQRSGAGGALSAWEDRILADPEIGARLTKLSGPEKKETMAKLVAHGMPRLGQPYLQQRVALINRILDLASLPECAAMGRGTIGSDGILKLVSRLQPNEIDQFIALGVEAARAEVRQTPHVQVSDQQLAIAVQAVMARLSPTDAQRFRTVLPQMQNPSFGNDGDVCWVGKVIYREVENLSTPHREYLRQGLTRWE